MSKITLRPLALAMRIALRCAASVLGLEKCVPETRRRGRGDEGLVDIAFLVSAMSAQSVR
jgi:hypothetical protein